jgi:transposase InsO family protein
VRECASGADVIGQCEENFEQEAKFEREEKTVETESGRPERVRRETRGSDEKTDRVGQDRECTETAEPVSKEDESYKEIQMEIVQLQRKKLLMEVSVLQSQKRANSTENTSNLEKSGLEKAFLSVFENVSDQSVKLDEYRGAGDVSVSTWIQRVRSVANLKGWSEEQIYKRSLLSLKSPARDAVQNAMLTDRNPNGFIFDMKSLERFLHKRYGVSNPVSHYLERFQKIKQAPSESGREFIERFQRIKTELDTACPGKFSDDVYLAWLKGGLRKSFKIELLKQRGIKTFSEAISVITVADQWIEMDLTEEEVNFTQFGTRGRIGKNRSPEKFGNVPRCQLCGKLYHTAEKCFQLGRFRGNRVNGGQNFSNGRNREFRRNRPSVRTNNQNFQSNNRNSNQRPVGSRACFYCGNEGHFKRDCAECKAERNRNWRRDTPIRNVGNVRGGQGRFNRSNFRPSNNKVVDSARFVDEDGGNFGNSEDERKENECFASAKTVTWEEFKPVLKIASCEILVGGKLKERAIVDTGATKSLLSAVYCSRLVRENLAQVVEEIVNGDLKKRIILRGADGKCLEVVSEVLVYLHVGRVRVAQQFLVVNDLANEMILGLDFISRNGVVLDFPRKVVELTRFNLKLKMFTQLKTLENDFYPDSDLVMTSQVILEPQTEKIVEVKCRSLDPLASATRIGFLENRNVDVRMSELGVRPGLVKLESGYAHIVISNMSRDVLSLGKETPVAKFVSAQVRRMDSESVYRVVTSENWNFDDQPDSFLLDSFGMNESQNFGKVIREKVDWRNVDRQKSEGGREKGPNGKIEKRCYQVLESSGFKHSPRNYEPSPHTLETIGPRDFEVEDSENEPSQFKVQFQVVGRKSEVVECEKLFPELTFEVKKHGIGVGRKIVEINVGDTLSKSERKAVLGLCAKYVDIFVRPPGPWVPSNVTPHTIDTGDAVPVRHPYRKVPFHQREAVERETTEMLKKGVIEESRSAWQSPVLLVKKPDGTIRFVIDFRKLNAVSKLKGGKIPLISEIFDALSGAEYFSNIDLASGYWQVPMAKEDQEKTGFLTHQSLYHFKVLPFGLKSAPFSFQRAMEKVFAGLQKMCHIYLDDIICHSKSFQVHLSELEQVFQRIKEAGMFCQPKKCYFGQSELKYLGFRISKKGVRLDPSKVSAVERILEPKNKTELQAFLGLTGHYRRFVEQYAKIAAPLHELTREVPFIWTERQAKAFLGLKRCLVEAPVLCFPNFEKEFILATDASDYSLGAVLSQLDETGGEKVVAYISHKLTEGEKKWTVREKEAFAVVWACDQLRYYLLGRHFVIKTDCSNITAVRWVLDYTKPGRLSRWALLLQEFDFTIESVAGKNNTVADALSRLPARSAVNLAVVDEKVSFAQEAGGRSSWGLPVMEDFRKLQNEDPLLCRVIAKLRGEKEDSEDVKEVLMFGGRFFISPENDLLMFTDVVHHACIVVPPKLRFKIYKHFHEMVMHAAFKRTYKLMARKFFWRGMATDVKNLIKECPSCQKNKAPPRWKHGELQLFPASEPWQIVVIDIFGPLPQSVRGNRYILVISCKFSRWVILVAMPDMKTTTIADCFVNEVIYVFGCPEKLLSDRGSQFTSGMFKRLMQRLGVDKIYTTAYHPPCNGQAERIMRFLAVCLRAYTEQFSHSDWDEYLPAIANACRIVFIDALKKSPYFILFGHEPTLPTDILYGSKSELEVDAEKYGLHQTGLMRKAFEEAREAQRKYDTKKKIYYDSKHVAVDFKIGDLVLLYTPRTKEGLSKKLAPRNSGPYKIVEKNSAVNFTVRELDGSKIGRIHDRVHVQRLIPYNTTSENFKRGELSGDWNVEDRKLDETNGQRRLEKEKGLKCAKYGEDEIEILDQRFNSNGGSEFLVKRGESRLWFARERLPKVLVKEFNDELRAERANRRLRY